MINVKIPFIGSLSFASPFEGVTYATSSLAVKVIRDTPTEFTVKQKLYRLRNKLIRGNPDDYGIVSKRVVTSVFVKYLCDCLAGTFTGTAVNTWTHDWGTGGATPESVSQQFLTASTEPTLAGNQVLGTKVSAAVGNNATLTSVAKITATVGRTISEHGVWLGNTGGDEVLVDRSVFTGIPIDAGNAIEFTYTLQFNSGG